MRNKDKKQRVTLAQRVQIERLRRKIYNQVRQIERLKARYARLRGETYMAAPIHRALSVQDPLLRKLNALRHRREINREVYQGLRSSDPATVRRAKRRVDGWLRTALGARTRAPGRRTRTP